jgi:hypothetical protein
MYGSYVYRGKSIPKMSGYQTAILVHKEGIMNNEEIYKYADKKLEKYGNRVFLSTWIPFTMGLFGLSMILFVVDYAEYSIMNGIIFIFGISLGGIMLWLVVNSWNKWFKIRRNYIYNLVRQDERARIALDNGLFDK